MQVHQRMQLANLFQFSSVAKDDTIFSEGDAGDTFYMILKGKVLQHKQHGMHRMGSSEGVGGAGCTGRRGLHRAALKAYE
jgi:hypothetical protein